MIKVHTPGARKGADFLVHVDPAQLKAQGVELVGFYLKHERHPNRTTPEQVAAYHKAGISVFLIHQRGYEGSGPTPALSGAQAGREATERAEALGYPKTMPIVYASMGDYDNTPKNVQGSKLYFDAAKKASGYPAGSYGDFDLFNAIGPTPLSVQAAAKAWSWDWAKGKWKGPHPTAHILQLPSRVVARPNVDNNPATINWYGTAVDPLDVLKPVKAWAPFVKPPTLTAPHKVIRLTKPLTRSPYVTALSECLVAYGWYSGVQDTYGPNLENAWRQTQKRFGTPVNGVYDELGRVKLQQYINTHPVAS